MSEYINKNELLKAMNTYDKFACTSAGCLERLTNSDVFVPYVKYDDMVKCVNNMPTADVVEVVRCKHCKDYDSHNHRCKFFNHGIVENDYCSRAIERREE